MSGVDPLAEALGITSRSPQEILESQKWRAEQRAIELDRRTRSELRKGIEESNKAPSIDERIKQVQQHQQDVYREAVEKRRLSNERIAELNRQGELRLEQQRRAADIKPSSVDSRPSTPRTARTAPATVRNPAQVAVAEPPSRLPLTGGPLTRLPSSLPQALNPEVAAAGFKTGIRGSLVGSAVILPIQIATGTPVGQALAINAGGILGAGIGGALGSIVAPGLGTQVGGVIGGVIGGAIADFIYGQAAPKKELVEGVPPSPPTYGLPSDNGLANSPYRVVTTRTWESFSADVSDQSATGRCTFFYDISPLNGQVMAEVPESYPPDGGITVRTTTFNPRQFIFTRGVEGNFSDSVLVSAYKVDKVLPWGTSGHNAARQVAHTVTYYRLDGASGPGILTPSAPPDKRVRDTTSHPMAQPTTLSNGQQVIGTEAAAVPGGTKSRENGTARGDSPTWVPHSGLKGTPNPATVPQNLGKDLPATEGAGKPKEQTETIPYLLNPQLELRPAPAPSKVSEAGTPLPTTKPAEVEPEPLPVPKKQLDSKEAESGGCTDLGWAWSCGFGQWPRSSDRLGGTGIQTYPDPKADNTATGSFAQGLGGPAAALLPGLPLVVGKAAEPTGNRITRPDAPPPAPDYSMPGSTCEIDPCLSGIQRKTQENGDKLDKLNAGLGAANLGAEALSLAEILKRLDKIDNKLGPQIPNGGIGGFLQNTFKGIGRLADWLQVDRLLNALTFITVLHNAYFLSSGLTQTLFSMVSNSLAIFGIKDSEGSPLEIQRIVGKAFDAWAKEILGVETVDGIKKAWAKYSRIYQAASNLLFSVTSVLWGIQEVLEIIGENVNRIGNALKKWGVVGESAYKWMTEKMSKIGPFGKFDRVIQGIGSATELTDNLEAITANVLDGQEQVAQFGTQKAELDKALKENAPKDQVQNQPLEDKASRELLASISPPISPVDEIKPES